MSTIDIREIADCTCAGLRQATRRITQLYDHALAPVGLTVSQFSLLGHLYGAEMTKVGGLSIKLLADRLGMDPSTLTRNLKPLAAMGLVADQADPKDGRARLVTMTARGRSKLKEAVPYWRKAQGALNEKLGADAAKKLRALLGAACATVEP
ncbi:MAG: MarR family winged helix-turn-helix transcriptional regulator [Methylovirgula sp.]